MFQQQNFVAEDKFKVFAKGLVSAFTFTEQILVLQGSLQYDLCSVHGLTFHGDKLRELPDRTLRKDEIIPDQDSISSSILNHLPGKRHEKDFSAYDPPELVHAPTEEGDPLSVLHLDSSFTMLTGNRLGVYYGLIYSEDGQPFFPMIKFTLKKSEEENTFVAAGAHHLRDISKDYTITGKRSPPSEDGKIPVELKISYATMWADIELTGVFDPEENSLRGEMGFPPYGTVGEFVFKRRPDFVRFYPAPSLISARTRWDFAKKAVLDRIRRETRPLAYALERTWHGTRYVVLSLRHHYGRDLNEDEEKELFNLYLVLSEADARFYASLIRIKLSETPIFS